MCQGDFHPGNIILSKGSPGGLDEYTIWLPIVAAARLSENISEVEGWLLEQVDARFSQKF